MTFVEILTNICVREKTMALGQANKGKKRKNSGNTKRNLEKRAAISYANLSSSSSKYMSNLSKYSEFEEIEDVNTDTEDSESLTQYTQESNHLVSTNSAIESNTREGFKQDSELSSKTVTCTEMVGSTEASHDFMSLIEDNWNVILMKLAQSSAWRQQEDSMRYMDESIVEMKNENDELRKRLKITEGRLTRAEKRLDDANEKILDLTTIDER